MMVKKAIEILQQDKEGFFLVVEGGRIDHAHHDGTARLALHELVEMDAALELAVQMLPGDDTLFVGPSNSFFVTRTAINLDFYNTQSRRTIHTLSALSATQSVVGFIFLPLFLCL
jgi:hypothetical protein